MLMTIPQMVLPMLLFYMCHLILTLLLAQCLLELLVLLECFSEIKPSQIIVKTYKSEKYSTLSAYKQTN